MRNGVIVSLCVPINELTHEIKGPLTKDSFLLLLLLLMMAPHADGEDDMRVRFNGGNGDDGIIGDSPANDDDTDVSVLSSIFSIILGLPQKKL